MAVWVTHTTAVVADEETHRALVHIVYEYLLQTHRPPMTAQELLGLGVIDRIVPEPKGGAHRDPAAAAAALGAAIGAELDALAQVMTLQSLLAELAAAERRCSVDAVVDCVS